MSRLPARVGFWAAVAESIVSLVYLVGRVILVATVLSRWSAADLAARQGAEVVHYARDYANDPMSFQAGLVVQVSAFLAGILLLIVFLALHELADPDRKTLARIASTFTRTVSPGDSPLWRGEGVTVPGRPAPAVGAR